VAPASPARHRVVPAEPEWPRPSQSGSIRVRSKTAFAGQEWLSPSQSGSIRVRTGSSGPVKLQPGGQSHQSQSGSLSTRVRFGSSGQSGSRQGQNGSCWARMTPSNQSGSIRIRTRSSGGRRDSNQGRIGSIWTRAVPEGAKLLHLGQSGSMQVRADPLDLRGFPPE
jgi:hypothetical protein